MTASDYPEEGSLVAWIGDNALHAMAYVALRVTSPMRAENWIARVATLLPRLSTVEAARAMMARLENRGTCLSRSVAVAARCADAHVVIGVVPRSRQPRSGPMARSIDAHAWVEVGDVSVPDARDTPWVELGRLGNGRRKTASNSVPSTTLRRPMDGERG
jgi:hypothetical protein